MVSILPSLFIHRRRRRREVKIPWRELARAVPGETRDVFREDIGESLPELVRLFGAEDVAIVVDLLGAARVQQAAVGTAAAATAVVVAAPSVLLMVVRRGVLLRGGVGPHASPQHHFPQGTEGRKENKKTQFLAFVL